MVTENKNHRFNRMIDLLAGAEMSIGIAKSKGIGAVLLFLVIVLTLWFGNDALGAFQPLDHEQTGSK